VTWDPDGFRRALRGKHEGATIDVFGSTIDTGLLRGGADRVLSVGMLVVPSGQRGQGVGSRIMKAITRYADQHGAIVTLTPDEPAQTLSDAGRQRYKARLVRWYKRFGFVENKGRRKDFRFRESMYRLPRRTG
jgi:GNAT superfamily N-acetyltransferase